MKTRIRIVLTALPALVLTVGAFPAAAGVFNAVGEPASVVEQCSRDAQCDDGLFCNGVERCDTRDPRADELGCLPAANRPCRADQVCLESEARCKEPCRYPEDGDRDGAINVLCGGGDCDDNDANRFPGNREVCDDRGHDEDCDPTTFGSRDDDRDGFVDAKCWNPRFDDFGRVIR